MCARASTPMGTLCSFRRGKHTHTETDLLCSTQTDCWPRERRTVTADCLLPLVVGGAVVRIWQQYLGRSCCKWPLRCTCLLLPCTTTTSFALPSNPEPAPRLKPKQRNSSPGPFVPAPPNTFEVVITVYCPLFFVLAAPNHAQIDNYSS